MATQFWRPIQPVEGQPIPDGAEWSVADGEWVPNILPVFNKRNHNRHWRVPVEVVPIDLAVDAIIENRAMAKCWRATGQVSVWVSGENLIADNLPQLRELVIAKLRELSQEKANATD